MGNFWQRHEHAASASTASASMAHEQSARFRALTRRVMAAIASIAALGSIAFASAQTVYADEPAQNDVAAAEAAASSQTQTQTQAGKANSQTDTALDSTSQAVPQPQTQQLESLQPQSGTGANGTVGTDAGSQPAPVAEPAQDQSSASAVQSLVTTVYANHPNAGGNESADNIKDRNPDTKWYEGDGPAPSGSQPITAIYTLSQPGKANGYVITSGNDFDKRDPKSWTILGSNNDSAAQNADDASWVELDKRSGQTFPDRHGAQGYAIAAEKQNAYKYYQLRITENNANTNEFQIADWTLTGTTAELNIDATLRSQLAATTWQYWDSTDSKKIDSDPTGGRNDQSWATGDIGAATSGWHAAAQSPFGVKHRSGKETVDLGNGFVAKTQLKRSLGDDGIVPAYYFRRNLTIASQNQLDSFKGLLATATYDDTLTVYVNGVRVAGYEDEVRGGNTGFAQGSAKSDPKRRLIAIPSSAFKVGENVIGVEVHQIGTSSSDAFLDISAFEPTSDALALDYAKPGYVSDSWPDANHLIGMLGGYDQLVNEPDTLDTNVVARGDQPTALNDKVLVQINHAASSDQRDKAVTDANNSPRDTMADALGGHLAEVYTQAKQDGKLPTTNAVLDRIGQGIDQTGDAKGHWHESRPYHRLGFSDAGGLIVKGNIGYGFTNDAFPSGHTTAGYRDGTALATLLPELGPQIMARASDYGNNRIVLGFHYPVDVMGGRMNGMSQVGYRWSDPEFRKLFDDARAELESALVAGCKAKGYGDTIAQCASDTASDSSDANAVAIYTQRLTYGFGQVNKAGADFKVPQGAADLLRSTFPDLTDAQREQIIKATALDSGYPLDKSNDGSDSWERVNLAAAMAAKVTRNADGTLKITSPLDSDATLALLEVDGQLIDRDAAAGKDGATLAVADPAAITGKQVIARTPVRGANVKTEITADNGEVKVTVTAPDKTTTHVYTVKLTKKAPAQQQPGDPNDTTTYVDPFVSTAGDHGQDMPGAQAPHGLVKANPLTTPGRAHSGYDYNQTHIAGFTQTGIDGTGGSGAGGDILVVPTSVNYTKRPDTGSYAHTFSHDDETAQPGYYQVGLGQTSGTDGSIKDEDGTIDARIAALVRTSDSSFTFPQNAQRRVVIDLKNNFTQRVSSSISVTDLPDGGGRKAISGKVVGAFGSQYTLYYYATTDQPVTSVKTWGDDGALSDAMSRDGVDTGAVLDFGPAGSSDAADDPSRTIGLKITLSPISVAQARIDQKNEIGDKTFEQVRTASHDLWKSQLNRVRITASKTNDPDGTLLRQFYTHLYRINAVPMNATSTTGTYRGVDGVVHQADGTTHYDSWSSWDDFRKFPILAMLYPDQYRDIVQSLIDFAADTQAASDAAGSAKNPGDLMQSVPTVRFERTPVIIADALSKGYTGFANLDAAWPALQRITGEWSADDLNRGYLADHPGDSVMRGYDDWAMSIIADHLGKTDDAAQYRTRAALPLKNQLKPAAWTAADGTKVNVLSSRGADGNFGDDNLEQFQAANLYQGTLWQYHWYDAYDMDGLIEAMGGRAAATAAIDHMFGETPDSDVTPDNGNGMLHSNANEVDLQTPYLFNYVGQADRTQRWVRNIFTKESWNRYIATGGVDGNEYATNNGEFTPPIKTRVYRLNPTGFLPTMDNDAGTMSATFVAAAIGLFPVTAGSSQYQIGTPFFDQVSITQPSGRTFTVNAKGASGDNYYIGSAKLDGAAWNNTWLDYNAIESGSTLSFGMRKTASDWGDQGMPAYSMSTCTGTGCGATIPQGAHQVSIDHAIIDAAADGKVDGSFTITLPAGSGDSAGVTFTDDAAIRHDPVKAGAVTVNGLTDGLDVTAAITGDRTLTVTLKGEIGTSARVYVTINDKALAGGVKAATLTGPGVSLKNPVLVSAAARARESLRALSDDARIIVNKSYSTSSFAAFDKARKAAADLLAKTAAGSGAGAQVSADEYARAEETLRAAIDSLAIRGAADRTLQAEQSEAWSGGELKNESFESSGDLGGVRDGAWVRYNDLSGVTDDGSGTGSGSGSAGSSDASKPIRSFIVRYSNKYGAADAKSTLDVHAGDQNGPVIAHVEMNGTNGFANYTTTADDLDDAGRSALTKAGYATIVFHMPSGRDWVGNFDWFRFSTEPASASQPSQPTALPQLSNANDSDHGGSKYGKELNLSDETQIQNVVDGTWMKWSAQDFGTAGAGTVTVEYDKPRSRAASGSYIELRLDANTAQAPSVRIPLDYTGDGWGTWKKTTVDVDPNVFKGVHDVYAAFVGVNDDANGHPYVANVRGFTFGAAQSGSGKPETVDRSALKTEIDGAARYVKAKDAYSWIDYAVFARALDAAKAAAAEPGSSGSGTGAATQTDVDEALRVLRLAERQLGYLNRLLLNDLVNGKAAALEQAGQGSYTDATWKAFTDALKNARAALATPDVNDDAASNETLGKAFDALRGAIDGLHVKGAPGVPTGVKVTVSGKAGDGQGNGQNGSVAKATVTWKAPASDGGSPVTGYDVRLDGGDPVRVNAGAGALRYVFTGLNAGKHSVQVRAVNAVGESAWTEAVAFTVAGTPQQSGGNGGEAGQPGQGGGQGGQNNQQQGGASQAGADKRHQATVAATGASVFVIAITMLLCAAAGIAASTAERRHKAH